MIGYTMTRCPSRPHGAGAALRHRVLRYGRFPLPYFGHKIALQVLGDAAGQTAFDDLAFPSYPFHAIAKQAVPVVETWYRIRDAAKI